MRLRFQRRGIRRSERKGHCSWVNLYDELNTLFINSKSKDIGMIISIQNPIKEQVLIKDNNVLNEHTAEGHGIGLANVRDTVEKYGGSFVISCDESKFTAVVVI